MDVVDDNAEEYLRSLKMTYSKPLPQGCLLEMGEFYVNYTVATPWTTPEFVSARRTVVVDNVNECLIKQGVGVGANCPELVSLCDVDAGSRCKDEIGTYTCRCPAGTEGDGFLPIPRLAPDGRGGYVGSMIPRGYKGGTGCRDTSKPVIELLGPNPKRFRVAKPEATRVRGVIVSKNNKDDDSDGRMEALIVHQRGAYESDIKSIIEATSGAELCATSSNRNVRPADCVRAEDHTYKGKVDLASRVSVGEPVPKDGSRLLQWRVPYDVIDDAGNRAETVWRDVIVEEVDIDDCGGTNAAGGDVVDRAVQEALTKERKTQQRNNNAKSRGCPPCDTCNCDDRQRGGGGGDGGNKMLSIEECKAMCDSSKMTSSDKTTCSSDGTSASSDHEIIQEMLMFIEGLMGPSAMMLLLLGCTLATLLYILRRMLTALFFSTGPNIRTYYHTREDVEREKIMMQNVSYYRSPTSSSNNGGSRQTPASGSALGSSTPLSSSSSTPRPPPTASLSSQRGDGGIFSPQGSGMANGTPASSSSPFYSRDGTDNIYQSVTPITPFRNTPNGTAPASQGSTAAAQSSRYNLRSTHY